MAEAVITPKLLKGCAAVPPSKSDVHRTIICAALSRGVSVLSPVDLSNDIKATIRCIEALGAVTQYKDHTLTVDGTECLKKEKAVLNCGESGSTLRFLIPVAAADNVSAVFTGEGRLPQRPIGIYLDTLPKAGVYCKTNGGLPLEISGQLKSGVFSLPGNVSSQFITGLLFALPLLDGASEIHLTSPLESAGYIDMTLETLKKFGIQVSKNDNSYSIPGNQAYRPQTLTTQGDWSQAAFFLSAGAVGEEVTVTGLDLHSCQGDKEILPLLERFGAEIHTSSNAVTVKRKKLCAIDIDARQIPDLVPVLSVVACFAEGTTKIYNAERLRIKESDRLTAVARALNSLGGQVRELPDGLEITGVPMLQGGIAEGCNDHRIVMSAAVAAQLAQTEVRITDAESIRKSYPNFFEDYNSLGGKAHVIDLG